ncbi:MAG TPA: deoxyribonuclease IV [Myxococcales bacterium]|nr:deoxyribonuclease IV [Myxococcales bacterium]
MGPGILLGAHESVAGGLHRAFGRAADDGAEALQIFTKNARGWQAKPLGSTDVAEFREEAARRRLPTAAHASYLINLAAEDPGLREKSIAGMADEVARCEALGVPLLVVHPGSHPDGTRGVQLVAEALAEVRRRQPSRVTRILLENTAGQGNCLGHDFAELAAMRRALRSPAWLGFCLDTCHLFAAGHDVTTGDGYRRTIDAFDEAAGIAHVGAFHLNDCKGPLGCRLDRHEDIGKGRMGLAGFEALVNDPRFAGVPAVLETEDGHQRKNLRALRALLH